MNERIFVLFLALTYLAGSVFAQTTEQSIKPVLKSGDVESIAADKIVIRTAAGSLEIVLTDKTEFKRVSAEKPSLTTATLVTRDEVAAGDKVTVSCLAMADGKGLWGRTVYLITQSELNQKRAKQVAEWRTRGISGKVEAINVQTNQIVVEIRSMLGSTKLTLTPKADAKFLRYASDSIKFADASPSNITEIKAGDQISALGDRSADGTAFSAETILTGSFRQLAGKVISVDVVNNEAVIEDNSTKKNLTIALGNAIFLKRFPPEMAERMASFQMPGAIRPAGQQGQGAPFGTPPVNGQTQPAGSGRMMGGFRSGGIDEMLERLPNITITDLKSGDMIAILTSGSQLNVGKVNALKLIAGVEPFIRMAEAAFVMSGRGQGGMNRPGLNIPGLEDIGIP